MISTLNPEFNELDGYQPEGSFVMIREVNANPFTKRLHYNVEEVSLEEFMSVLSKQQKECEDSQNFDFIASRVNALTK